MYSIPKNWELSQDHADCRARQICPNGYSFGAAAVQRGLIFFRPVLTFITRQTSLLILWKFEKRLDCSVYTFYFHEKEEIRRPLEQAREWPWSNQAIKWKVRHSNHQNQPPFGGLYFYANLTEKSSLPCNWILLSWSHTHQLCTHNHSLEKKLDEI